MTAIAGYWSAAGSPTVDACAAILRAQQPFGPHDRTQNDLPSISMGRNLFRLLPEDRLDSGPIIGAGGRLHLVADIRLDDRHALGRALGLDARDHCDASLAMAAFERWSDGALDRLYGDFALSLWDAERRRLLLARDPTGQKPLHYCRGSGVFAFASMPQGLHALSTFERLVDPDAVADFLGVLPESDGRSFFVGIDKVPAGHVVDIGISHFSVRRWWQPLMDPIAGGSPQLHVEALRDALDHAVEARLRGSRERVASHLSAGLDSAAVTATAARLIRDEAGRVVAYTAVPRHGDIGDAMGGLPDEGPLAAQAASLYPNIEHVRVTGSDRPLMAGLKHNGRFYERPMLNVANMNWVEAIQDDARDRGLKVLLTGASGNLTLSYDGLHALPEMLARGHWLSLLIQSLALHRSGSRWGSLGARTFGPFLPKLLWRRLREWRMGAGSSHMPLLRENVLAELVQRAADRGTNLEDVPASDSIRARLNALAWLDPGNYQKGTLAGWGIDVRDPTADRALLELCLRIPVEAWIEGGRPRGLARIAFSDRLPEAIVNERRKGLQAADWHLAFDRDLPDISAELERIADCPDAAKLLDIDRMRALLIEWPKADARARRSYHIYRQGLLRAIAAGHFIRSASLTPVDPAEYSPPLAASTRPVSAAK